MAKKKKSGTKSTSTPYYKLSGPIQRRIQERAVNMANEIQSFPADRTVQLESGAGPITVDITIHEKYIEEKGSRFPIKNI